MRRMRDMGRLFALLLVFAIWGNGKAMAQSLPMIMRHSQTSFAVYRGDQLAIEVQAQGDGLAAKWIAADGSILCRALTCEVDTGTWGLGTHKVSFVLFNDQGSLYLKYSIRILIPPAGYRTGKVKPPLIEDQTGIEQVGTDDLMVKAMRGRGFSYRRQKLQVVGPLPRALAWDEKLRTQPGAVLRFGRESSEAHLLAPSSAAYLVKTPSGRRVIALVKGALRSRVLASGVAPRWSIIAGDWVQVDTNAIGDVLVERQVPDTDGDDRGDGGDSKSPEAVTVTVLRGQARVVVTRGGDGDKGPVVSSLVVPQGLAVRLVKGEDAAPKPEMPDVKATNTLVAGTTPEYLPGAAPVAKNQSLLGGKVPKTLGAATDLAKEAIQKRDFFVALEALTPFAAAAKSDYDASLALGEAYAGVFLGRPALDWLKTATSLRPEAAAAPFQRGLLALGMHRYTRAIQAFETAEDRGFADAQLLEYYLGVAKYAAKQPMGARSAFTRSLWATGGVDAVRDSARSFRRHIEQDSWVDLAFGTGVFYDTNVLRSDKLDPKDVGEGLGSRKGAGYTGSFNVGFWPQRSQQARLGMTFDVARQAYFASSLKALAVVDQGLGLKFGLGYGGEGDEPRTLTLDAETGLRQVYLGDDSAADEVLGGLALGAPRLLGFSLGLKSTMVVDPQPTRDDILDPVLWEVVPAGDRSVRLLDWVLGLVPVDGDVWHLGLNLRSGTGRYRSQYHGDDDFTDLALSSHLTYALSFRQELAGGLDWLTRSFTKSEDHRKDTRTGLDVDWTWHFTPVLSSALRIDYQSQKSSRDVNTYKRQVYSYGLNLRF